MTAPTDDAVKAVAQAMRNIDMRMITAVPSTPIMLQREDVEALLDEITRLQKAVPSPTAAAVADGWTLADLRSANAKRQAEWCSNGEIPDLSFRGLELAGEVGEACNVAKKLERERLGWRGSRATLDDLAQEIADVVICADLMALSAGVDLMSAVRAKFNTTTIKVGLTTLLDVAPTPSPVEDAKSVTDALLAILLGHANYAIKRAEEFAADGEEPTAVIDAYMVRDALQKISTMRRVSRTAASPDELREVTEALQEAAHAISSQEQFIRTLLEGDDAPEFDTDDLLTLTKIVSYATDKIESALSHPTKKHEGATL